MNQSKQVFELEATLDSEAYTYRLVIEFQGEPARPIVALETVTLNGRPVFTFAAGEVQLYDDTLAPGPAYPFSSDRSALATIQSRSNNQRLMRFKQWLWSLLCFKMNPFAMQYLSESETPAPAVTLVNFASWYRYLLQVEPRANKAFLESLHDAIEGFGFLTFEPVTRTASILQTDIVQGENGNSARFDFGELSDGQRCLICLYAILHFVLAHGNTVILDEPENFVSLRELHPWLLAVTDRLDYGAGQLLLISHHPEFIDQWAPEHRVRFVREDNGPVRLVPFPGDPASGLSPSELVARGWERE